ncbi:TIGR03885 family FMN-dependent LLM class oxidoreductase [Limoniibacter endophyticus]|uniref:LLM class F420-dependent oxidoreductase n=1 Tax=Limoniibacter endophyticus TaxID=1565040 RepID=A0A8J3GFL7_9HYPH|nr:TIGR03885 family FMN-dependent LLM class oxidoreductase [Limoniibacter endophyticus]GHC63697.1 LLM class F420-dependent oxidoreductase [Limoniibacter endophyticus]
MRQIGYHASHEQFAPSELLDLVRLAEAAGFDAIMSSDHLAPWGAKQGQSGFAWSWLGAAMQASRLPFSIVTTPIGIRYHPLLIAQAVATLAAMYPDRLTIILGSGEALNERPFGIGWPAKDERVARLEESVAIIRALFRGEEVTTRGFHRLENARLYTLPAQAPAIYAAALSLGTAHRASGWADGLATINMPSSRLRAIIDAFREGAGEEKPIHVQVHLSYADDLEKAQHNTLEQWKTNALPAPIAAELYSPQMFDDATQHLRIEDLEESVLISPSPSQHADWVQQIFELGADCALLHNVGRNQQEFIKAFAEKVLPQFKGI